MTIELSHRLMTALLPKEPFGLRSHFSENQKST